MLNNNILDLVLVSVLDSILIGNGVNMSSRFVGIKDWVEELCILVSQIKIFLSLAFCLTILSSWMRRLEILSLAARSKFNWTWEGWSPCKCDWIWFRRSWAFYVLTNESCLDFPRAMRAFVQAIGVAQALCTIEKNSLSWAQALKNLKRDFSDRLTFWVRTIGFWSERPLFMSSSLKLTWVVMKRVLIRALQRTHSTQEEPELLLFQWTCGREAWVHEDHINQCNY